jgi:hypothetical protein
VSARRCEARAFWALKVPECVFYYEYAMPRTKEFDEAEVLDQALELFRARGFRATSFADLTAELGVSIIGSEVIVDGGVRLS